MNEIERVPELVMNPTHSERRLPGGRAAGFQPAAMLRKRSRQDAGGTAGWKPALLSARRKTSARTTHQQSQEMS